MRAFFASVFFLLADLPLCANQPKSAVKARSSAAIGIKKNVFDGIEVNGKTNKHNDVIAVIIILVFLESFSVFSTALSFDMII